MLKTGSYEVNNFREGAILFQNKPETGIRGQSHPLTGLAAPGEPRGRLRSPEHALLGEHFGLTRLSVNFSY